MAPKTKLFWIMLAIALPLDQLSKQWIVATYRYGERQPLIAGWLDLTHVRNPGGAFSFFADGHPEHRMLFFVGTTLLAVVLLAVFYRRLEPNDRLASFALGMILGGALGNLIDRLAYGEVIDFIDVHLLGGYIWPTFNFADSFIVVGVIVLMLDTFRTVETPEESGTETSGPIPAEPHS